MGQGQVVLCVSGSGDGAGVGDGAGLGVVLGVGAGVGIGAGEVCVPAHPTNNVVSSVTVTKVMYILDCIVTFLLLIILHKYTSQRNIF